MELASQDLIEMYRLMILTRRFEERTIEWYQEGRIPETIHSSIGQEAIGVGACYGLRRDDQVLPSLRTRAAFFAKGVPVRDVLASMCARETSLSRGKDTSHHAAAPEYGVLVGSHVVGSSIPVAVGAALAMKLRKTDLATLCFFGDGASNRGDFHEGLNMAGANRLPIVFVCENNLYAMSVPVEWAMAIEDIAARASSYGFPGVVVDGNDVRVVHEAAAKAVRRARAGEGPTLIECKTYRLRNHVELPLFEEPWRPSEEIIYWKEKDPIKRLRRQLVGEMILTEELDEEIRAGVEAELEQAMRYAEESPFPEGSEALQDVYA
jgi:TPP-dependent pyruvate/acetoin dehydrogenase alpha subunit